MLFTRPLATLSLVLPLAFAQFDEWKISQDGKCGPGVTCYNSVFGDCCSAAGYCGKTKEYCFDGCQWDYGDCEIEDFPLPTGGGTLTFPTQTNEPTTTTTTTKPTTTTTTKPTTTTTTTTAKPTTTTTTKPAGTECTSTKIVTSTSTAFTTSTSIVTSTSVFVSTSTTKVTQTVVTTSTATTTRTITAGACSTTTTTTGRIGGFPTGGGGLPTGGLPTLTRLNARY